MLPAGSKPSPFGLLCQQDALEEAASPVAGDAAAAWRQASAVSRQPSAVSRQPSAVSRQASAVSCQPFALSRMQSATDTAMVVPQG